uniref:Retrotransposon gag domain-containing protein n=1 Tax=Cyprinus carpio carpio TaxID=630221 RepID=A0A9J7X6B8_CYPCA
MEAASSTSLSEFIHHSVNRMDQQQESIVNTGRAVQALVTQVSELTQQIQQLTIPAAPPAPSVPRASTEPSYRPEPRLPVPENYSGEPNYCRTFITKCSMHFSLQPRTFETEESKVAFVLTLLSGRAALWGTAVWENRDPCCASFHSLSEEMKRVFDRAAAGKEAARELTDLKQGNLSVADYSIRFRTLAAACKWNEEAQWDMFLHGLADRVHKEIYLLELPTSLNGLIDLALRVDARIERLGAHACPTRLPSTLESGSSSRENTVGPVFDHEPMQVGRARLTREERERRRSRGLCLYCGGSGHFLLSCPVKRASPVVNLRLLSGGISAGKSSTTSTLLPVKLRWANNTHTCHALLDSGAEGNFMDTNLAQHLKLPITPLSHQITVNALNGQVLPCITHTTGPITLLTSGNHTENIPFLLMDSPVAPIVLGHPWLVKHNPRVDWGSNTITSWKRFMQFPVWLPGSCPCSSVLLCSLLSSPEPRPLFTTGCTDYHHGLLISGLCHALLLHLLTTTSWIIICHRCYHLLFPLDSVTFLLSINITFNSCICFLTHLLPLHFFNKYSIKDVRIRPLLQRYV